MVAMGQLGFHMTEVGAIRKGPCCQLTFQSLRQGLRPGVTVGGEGEPPPPLPMAQPSLGCFWKRGSDGCKVPVLKGTLEVVCLTGEAGSLEREGLVPGHSAHGGPISRKAQGCDLPEPFPSFWVSFFWPRSKKSPRAL